MLVLLILLFSFAHDVDDCLKLTWATLHVSLSVCCEDIAGVGGAVIFKVVRNVSGTFS